MKKLVKKLTIILFFANFLLSCNSNKNLHKPVKESFNGYYKQLNFYGNVHFTYFKGEIKSIIVVDEDHKKVFMCINDSIRISDLE